MFARICFSFSFDPSWYQESLFAPPTTVQPTLTVQPTITTQPNTTPTVNARATISFREITFFPLEVGTNARFDGRPHGRWKRGARARIPSRIGMRGRNDDQDSISWLDTNLGQIFKSEIEICARAPWLPGQGVGGGRL